MAVHVQLEIQIARPVSEVFDFLADGTNLPRWMPEFAEVEQSSSGPAGLGTTYRYRFARPAVSSVLRWSEFERDRKLAWDGAPVGPGAVVPAGTLLVDAVPGGTLVRAHYRADAGGPLRLVERLQARALRRTRERDLVRLKAILEA